MRDFIVLWLWATLASLPAGAFLNFQRFRVLPVLRDAAIFALLFIVVCFQPAMPEVGF